MSPNEFPELRSFFNEKEQIIAMPAKRKKLLLAVYYLSDKIEPGRDYTESEINDLLDGWTTFHDPAILRRELYNTCLLERTPLLESRKYSFLGGIHGKVHLDKTGPSACWWLLRFSLIKYIKNK
jgi:hypothetical protein